MRFDLMPAWRTLLAAAAGAALFVVATAAPDGPTRPGSGSRPRRTSPGVPVPPPPPSGEWTTQTGPRTTGPQGNPSTTETPQRPAEPAPEPPAPAAPPAPDPLFDDRPVASFEPVTWMHQPSGQVVSTESYTEAACSRLLVDASLPPASRAALLGGRARAHMRMWRLDAARRDIEAALALDGRAAPLHLIHAEILACSGRADEADGAIQEAVLRDPESSFSARVLGLLRFQQGSMQSAADALAVHLEHTAQVGTAAGDATLALLRAVAASELGLLAPVADDPAAPWIAQLTGLLTGRIGRDVLLERARQPRGASPDEAACTAWFYLGMRSLASGDRDRAGRDFLAALRTGYTAGPEYRLAVAELIRLRVLRADSLPGRLAQ